MAKPRIFISSTYFDLKSVRDDLERFVIEKGFEPVLHERGHIPYQAEETLENSCYKEIEYSDILICIIGGRLGSSSKEGIYSVTQKELKTAIELGKQVYIFIDKSVQSEFKYYQSNKDIKNVRYNAVDDIKIYEFIEDIYSLPKGNPIFGFETISDITKILREQWAGLFQRLLDETAIKKQSQLTEELQSSLKTVSQLVEYLVSEKGKGDQAIKEILISNHPIFSALKRELKTKYRIFFTSLEELNDWLDGSRSFTPVDEDAWDDSNYIEWVRQYDLKSGKEQWLLKVNRDLFETNGKLKPLQQDNWDNSWVSLIKTKIEQDPGEIDPAIPF